MKNIFLLLLLFLQVSTLSKNQWLRHSHNDYENQSPFYTAFDAGFESIEADIFLIGNKLFVAHSREKIEVSRTFERLYLKPLARLLKNVANLSPRLGYKPTVAVLLLKS